MDSPAIVRRCAEFLQFLIVLIGLATLALLLWEPHLEGRNVNATVFEIYFNDPFLAYAYMAAIPVFIGYYQAFSALEHVRQDRTFSPATAQALRTIKYCALAVIGFLMGGEAWLFLYQSGKDDIAGGVAVGLFFIVCSLAVAVIAAMLERMVQKGMTPANAIGQP